MEAAALDSRCGVSRRPLPCPRGASTVVCEMASVSPGLELWMTPACTAVVDEAPQGLHRPRADCVMGLRSQPAAVPAVAHHRRENPVGMGTSSRSTSPGSSRIRPGPVGGELPTGDTSPQGADADAGAVGGVREGLVRAVLGCRVHLAPPTSPTHPGVPLRATSGQSLPGRDQGASVACGRCTASRSGAYLARGNSEEPLDTAFPQVKGLFALVAGEGFEPSKLSRWIYSPLPLAARATCLVRMEG